MDLSVLTKLLVSLGLDPIGLLASLILYIVVREGVPLTLFLLRKLSDYINSTPTKLDDMALPVIKSISTKLEGVDEANTDLNSIAKLVAQGIVDGVDGKKDAKRVADELGSKILDEVKAKIKSSQK
jgi:hypothetical protein